MNWPLAPPPFAFSTPKFLFGPQRRPVPRGPFEAFGCSPVTTTPYIKA